MLLYALYITKKIMTKIFSFKVGKSGGKAFISRLAYSVLVIITTKKHIIDKKLFYIIYCRWKSFLVFADQSVISSETASAIGFGYTRVTSNHKISANYIVHTAKVFHLDRFAM